MHGLFHSAINVPTDHIYSVCPHTPFAKSTCDMPILNCMSACSNIKSPKYIYDNSACISGFFFQRSCFNVVFAFCGFSGCKVWSTRTHTSLRLDSSRQWKPPSRQMFFSTANLPISWSAGSTLWINKSTKVIHGNLFKHLISYWSLSKLRHKFTWISGADVKMSVSFLAERT